MTGAYYNEHDKFAAAWLRELIKRNVIAPGEVDERDIQQVSADEIRGFTQCHFFAGIGVWSYALRQAGWPDAQRVWTGSCPCQPFSVSGTRGKASDERHLWPDWFPLIRECRAGPVFGEQVASDDGLAWLDNVSFDLENAGYTIGAIDTCAAGFGAPHIRQRLYWVAESAGARCDGTGKHDGGSPLFTPRFKQRIHAGDVADTHQLDARTEREQCGGQFGQPAKNDGSDPSNVAHASGRRCEQRDAGQWPVSESDTNSDVGDTARGRFGMRGSAPGDGGRVALSGESDNVGQSGQQGLEGYAGDGDNGHEPGRIPAQPSGPASPAGTLNGFWRGAEWIPCRDGKARPVEPGTFPLAHGAAARVGRLRGYGNAIVAPQAIEFIKAYVSLRY